MSELPAAIAILSAGALVRSTLGFGEALVAVPLLALWMPVEKAAPAVVLVSVSIAALVLAQEWRNVQFRGAIRLIGSTMFGIPVGLGLLSSLPAGAVKGALGLMVFGFALYGLRARPRKRLHHDGLAWLFGFGAGVLGGAYGMNGPPLAIYGSLRGWSRDEFRATLQAYFLPAGLAALAGFWLTGAWTRSVSELYFSALPGVVLAVIGGRALQRRIRAESFGAYVYGGLAVTGAVLLSQAALR